MTNKTNKRKYQQLKKLDDTKHTDLTGLTKKCANLWEISKNMAALIKRKLRRTNIIEEMHAIYHDKDSNNALERLLKVQRNCL